MTGGLAPVAVVPIKPRPRLAYPDCQDSQHNDTIQIENSRLKRKIKELEAESYDKCKFVYNEVKQMYSTANVEAIRNENGTLKRDLQTAHERIDKLGFLKRDLQTAHERIGKLEAEVNALRGKVDDGTHNLRRKIRGVIRMFHPDKNHEETLTPTCVVAKLTSLLEDD